MTRIRRRIDPCPMSQDIPSIEDPLRTRAANLIRPDPANVADDVSSCCNDASPPPARQVAPHSALIERPPVISRGGAHSYDLQ
jgi:hypothetical protein